MDRRDLLVGEPVGDRRAHVQGELVPVPQRHGDGEEVERDEEAILKAEAMLRSQYAASAAELWADGYFVVRVQRPSDWS